MSRIFPKKIKLANGGGIGIQYANKLADTPDVSAAELLLETERRNEAYLEEERLKKKPNRAALMESISKREGTAGEKAAFQSIILAQLDEYDKRSRQEPNWVFSQEGTDKFAQLINESIDPARSQQMANNYRDLQFGYESLAKSGGLDMAQVNNGKVLVKDSTDGQTKQINIAELDSKIHTPLSSRSRYNDLSNSSQFKPGKDEFFTGITSADNAKRGLLSSFDNSVGAVAGMYSKDGMPFDITSNAKALAAAKQQAKGSITNEVRSSLQSDYLRKLNGSKYSEQGFDAYVDSILNTEVQKRRRESSSLSSEGIRLMAEMRKAADDDQKVIEPQTPWYHTTNRSISVNDTEWGDSIANIHISGDSNIPTNGEIIPSLGISGNAWISGGGSDEGNYSSDDHSDPGRIAKLSRKFENMQHVSNSLASVTTGRLVKNGKYVDSDVNAGRLIYKTSDDSEDYEYGNGTILDGSIVQNMTISVLGDDGKTYQSEIQVMPRTDGSFVEVKSVGVEVYQGDIDGKEGTIFKPMDRPTALKAFGINASMYGSNTDYFTDNLKFPSDPTSAGQSVLQLASRMNPAKYQMAKSRIEQELASGPMTWQKKERINAILNDLRDGIEDGSIVNTFSFSKKEHTSKGDGDFIRQ